MSTGWELKTVGELCDIIGGGTPSKSNAAFFNGSIPWATIRDMKSDWIESTEHSITPEAVKQSATNVLPRGTVVVASRVGLGKVCRVREDTAINQDLRGFIPKPKVQLDIPYLFWWFKSVSDQIIAAGNGATVQGVTLPFLRSLKIPLPPLDEQRRIVDVLDKAFTAISTATANAQTNLADARALFEGYLESILTNRGDDWQDVTLGKACKVERGSSPRPIKSFVTTENDGQNWIKIGDTKHDSKYVTQTRQRITPAGALKSRRVDPGDFILTNSMSFGKPYIMKISGYIHDGWFALRLNEGIDTEYFYYLLSSPIAQMQFQNLAAGAIVLNISGDLVKKAVLPIPPIDQQLEIVKRIQLADFKTGQLKRNYGIKLGALAELKQSLLQKAFAGELAAAAAAAPANDNFTTAQGTAQIIAFGYWLHKKQNRDRSYKRVKAQKCLHNVESIGCIELGRQPIKQRNGPHDEAHMSRAEVWAKANGFFEFVPSTTGPGLDFKKLANYDALWVETVTATKPVAVALERAIDPLIPMDMEKAELFATVHAAWNNLICNGATINDDAIVKEARDDWHADKLKIPEHKFRDTIRTIKAKGMEPDGSAKYVGGQANLF